MKKTNEENSCETQNDKDKKFCGAINKRKSNVAIYSKDEMYVQDIDDLLKVDDEKALRI